MARRRKGRPKRLRSGSLVGKRLNLDVVDMASGGYALARHRGKPVLLPYALPGERVRVEIVEDRGALSFARGLRLIAASSDRIASSCPHFGPGACWGCHFQHISYPAQLLLKQDILADQLSRLGELPDALIDAAMRPMQPAAKQWAYNSRLRLERANGDWGLPRQHKGGIEAISACHIAHPDLLQALAAIDFDYPAAKTLTLQRGSDAAIMLIIHVEAEKAPDLHTDLPLSVNLILPDNEPVNLIGDSHSRFDIGGRAFRVTAGAYIRPNVAGIEALNAAVVEAAALNGEERALELYAGVGVLSASLAEKATSLTTVESYPPAVSDAEINLRHSDNIDIVEGGVEAALEELAASEARFDIALVDPPGSGLNAAIISNLARLGIRRLVYVSGQPASLARDCKNLLAAGFQLEALQPLDLAPQTHYITAVASFAR